MAGPSEATTTVNFLLGGASFTSTSTTSSANNFYLNATTLAPSQQLVPSTTAIIDENQVFDVDSATVAFTLTVLMSIGIGLNGVLLLVVIFHPRVRQLVNAFIGHYAAISVLKCIFCIVFATSLTTRFEAALCDKIGGSYVVLTSVEVFNLLAMVCAEAYFFGQANVGRDGRGSCCCVMIGLFLIYLGSVILHLGPTIIAGGIGFNRTAGSCIFGFKSIQSYVAHAIWIVITTLGITAVLYYLSVVYREVQSCRPHRIASLVRASVPTTTRSQTTVDQMTVRRIVADSQRRAIVLILVTCTFVLTSYPLFLLTLFDIGFTIEGSMYRIFTFFSWLNTLINPILFLLVDRKFGIIRLLKPCGSSGSNRYGYEVDSYKQQQHRASSSSLHHRQSSSLPVARSDSISQATDPTMINTSLNSKLLQGDLALTSNVYNNQQIQQQRSSTLERSKSNAAANCERTGLLLSTKSVDRLHQREYRLEEEEDMTLMGCGAVSSYGGGGANSLKSSKHSINAASQPPVLNEWQNRVGGRLYLQGELLGAAADMSNGNNNNNDEESVMVMEGPQTVILYDRLTNAPQLLAEQQEMQPRQRAATMLMGDFSTSSTLDNDAQPGNIQLVPCFSATSLSGAPMTPGTSTRHAYVVRNINNVMPSTGQYASLVSMQQNHHQQQQHSAPMTSSGSSTNSRTIVQYHHQQPPGPPPPPQPPQMMYSSNAEFLTHHNNQQQQQQLAGIAMQPLKIYRPHLQTAEQQQPNNNHQHQQQATPSAMMLMAQQRQLQQQMQFQQVPSLRLMPGGNNFASNISFRAQPQQLIINNNQSSSATNSLLPGGGSSTSAPRPVLTNTMSFIGTEDSLDDIAFTAMNPQQQHQQQQSFLQAKSSFDRTAEDDETTC